MVIPINGTQVLPGTGWDENQPNSELQDHVAFFDKDKDGIIWPTDTFRAFRELGFGLLFSALGMLAIHFGLSWITWGTWIPDIFWRLKINRMHKAKHGSDTGVYSSTGQFDPERFDYQWDMYTAEPHTHMTFSQMMTMVQGDRNPFDPYGWAVAMFEWIPVWIMLNPADGYLSKEDVKAVYNGSIFWKIAAQVQQKKKGGSEPVGKPKKE